jgi:hypothetical protein
VDEAEAHQVFEYLKQMEELDELRAEVETKAREGGS